MHLKKCMFVFIIFWYNRIMCTAERPKACIKKAINVHYFKCWWICQMCFRRAVGLFCLSELSGFSIWSGLTSCTRLIHSNKRKEAMFYKAKNALFSAKWGHHETSKHENIKAMSSAKASETEAWCTSQTLHYLEWRGNGPFLD